MYTLLCWGIFIISGSVILQYTLYYNLAEEYLLCIPESLLYRG